MRFSSLVQRGNLYYFQCRVPADIKRFFPVTQIRKSLKTNDRKQAVTLVKLLTATTERLFFMARSGILTPKLIEHLVQEFMDNMLDTPDTTLANEEIIKLYKRRWDIEVFFKMAKSFLQLAKECQSRSYDAMVAHATLVCCRYLILEIGKRTTADPRTLGTLFHATCDEIRQTSFAEAIALLLKLLKQTLNAVVEFSKEQVEHLVLQFIEQLQPVFRGRLLLLPPTSV